MDLKYLNTFLTIVEENGFSKAAEKLNYTQSTITFQIQQLELELSAKLFEKIGRRMMLTKAGEHLVPYVREVLSSVDKMRCFESGLAQFQGDLHVGVGESLLCYKAPALLQEFHRKAPGARIFLRSMNCYDIRDELLDGTLDLGLFYSNVGGYGSNLTVHAFGSYPLTLVGSPEIKRAYPDFITSDQEIPIPFIINEPNCIFRQIFEKYVSEKSIRMGYTIELWSIPTIKNLVINHMGVSFLPRFTVQEELERGELEEIQTDITDVEISAVCGHHKNKWISPLMQLFLDLCREQLSPDNEARVKL